MAEERNILVPAPTAWPFLAAFGVTLLFAGLVTHPAVSVVGSVVLLRSAVGWWFEVLPVENEEAVPLSPDQAPVTISTSGIDRLTAGVGGHRITIPTEVHPISAGLYGGLAGAAVMAAVAMLFGLISQGSIWYPINLLAASVVPSMADAPTDQLRQFSSAGLITGSIIHASMSLFVGLLYAVMLPMFPRGAAWHSGLVTPLLWSGLVAATLDVINPTLNARIDWLWFVASQVAFGMACGWVVAHTEKIETMQSWPLADRAGIESARREGEGSER